jgi:hypothetical protein
MVPHCRRSPKVRAFLYPQGVTCLGAGRRTDAERLQPAVGGKRPGVAPPPGVESPAKKQRVESRSRTPSPTVVRSDDTPSLDGSQELSGDKRSRGIGPPNPSLLSARPTGGRRPAVTTVQQPRHSLESLSHDHIRDVLQHLAPIPDPVSLPNVPLALCECIEIAQSGSFQMHLARLEVDHVALEVRRQHCKHNLLALAEGDSLRPDTNAFTAAYEAMVVVIRDATRIKTQRESLDKLFARFYESARACLLDFKKMCFESPESRSWAAEQLKKEDMTDFKVLLGFGKSHPLQFAIRYWQARLRNAEQNSRCTVEGCTRCTSLFLHGDCDDCSRRCFQHLVDDVVRLNDGLDMVRAVDLLRTKECLVHQHLVPAVAPVGTQGFAMLPVQELPPAHVEEVVHRVHDFDFDGLRAVDGLDTHRLPESEAVDFQEDCFAW